MKLRFYQGLDPDSIPNFKRFAKAIEADDIARADIKKIGDNLYRAKLGRSARLLFAFYSHSQQTECLVLEYLPKTAIVFMCSTRCSRLTIIRKLFSSFHRR